MTADSMKKGNIAIVKAIGDGETKLNLLEMGIRPGKTIEFLNSAIWGGPIAFQIENNIVAIRISEAAAIEIDLIEKQ
jgi:ferrous iron transport protein A